MTEHIPDAQVIVDTAREGIEPTVLLDVDSHHLVALVDANGARLQTVDVEQWGSRPTRKRGSLTHHTGASLARYVNAHQEGTATALYADVEARRVVAVLNDHEQHSTYEPDGNAGVVGEEPGWGDHRATLALRHSPEWKAWTARDGQLGDQTGFAIHVDERLVDIVDPPGADLLELIQTFQANTDVAFRSAVRLDSGETQLRYEETIDAKAGRAGDMTIPNEFTLRLRPFEGSEAVEVRARLRYRVREGQLSIGYQLIRPEDVIREAFDEVLAFIETDTGIEAYRGAAPDPRQ